MSDTKLSILPAPRRITFDTNPGLCNLRCIMCDTHSEYAPKLNGKSSSNLMEFEIVEETVRECKELGLQEIIPSTMGEPLLYPDFERLINLVKECGIKLNITTNGTFPRLGVKNWAYKLIPVSSDIKISINGSVEESASKIMRGINPKKQLENIKLFLEAREALRAKGEYVCNVTFQVTFLESNLSELPSLLELAISLGIDRFKGHHLWVTWEELKEENLLRNEESIYRWNKTADVLRDIAERLLLPNGAKCRLDNVNHYNLNSDDPVPEDALCPFLGKEAWVATDGTFNVCCCPDVIRKQFGYFGNVKERGLLSLWNSDKYRSFVSEWGDRAICRKCNMRRKEKGGK